MTNSVVDQMGRELVVPSIPLKVVSLVPSQTELISYLGVEKLLAGITKFCVRPPHLKSQIEIVGGTKSVNISIIDEIQPELIIANKEENTKDVINQLSVKYPVWVSDVSNLEEAYDMILAIGNLLNVGDNAQHLVDLAKAGFNQITPHNKRKSLYFIWHQPKMVAGKGTFIDCMMQVAGFENYINLYRYPELSMDDLDDYYPEVVLLSSEPFPFSEKHIVEYKTLFPNAEIKLVDGEIFSWYGSRLLKAPEYFQQLQN